VASSNAAGIEDVTSYLDRIELSISKQAEINLMENRETDALGRFERAVALRQNTQRRLRELDAATGELSNKRSEIEKQSDAIDKQSNDSRNKRFDAEKRLASTITAMSEGRSQISKADNKLQEAHGRIMALQGKRQTVSQEIETLFGSRGAIRKDKRNVDSQLRDLEKKFSLVPAKDLQASLEDIDRQLDKLDDRYRSNAGDLNGLQSERERLVGKLGKLVSLSQDVNQHRAGNDTEFNQRTKELFEVEKALDDDYNEMRSIEKNRDKFETSIQNNMKSLAEFEQQTAETEAQLHTLIANRDLDNSLLNLDKQREAGGVKLETYEQQRDALVQNMEDNSKQVRAKRDQLREIGKKWDQVVDQSASLHDKINALEDERAQIATKNIDLLDKRKRARFLIDEVLRKRNNIDSATDKIEKQLAEHLTKMVAFDVKWAGLVKQRNDLVDEITTLEKRREQIWDSLGKARLAAGSSLNDQISAKEYREKLQDQLVVYDRLKQATSSWLQKMHDLQAVEQQWRTVASEVDDHLKERKQLADKWFEKRQQRDQLLLERNKSDQITVTLREQRDKLEEQRLAVENKRKDFLQTRQKMKSDQTQQLSAELALEQELLEQVDKRRDAVRRDLLKEFNEKNPGRAMQSTKADLVSPVINPNAKAPSGKNNGKKARGK
jgi:chromosome segregation ATPase